MSHIKTTSLTAGAVLALAALPFSQQRAEGRRMQSELQAIQSQQSTPEGRPEAGANQGAQVRNGVRTPAVILAALEDPADNRLLIRDLLEHFGGGDTVENNLARMRIAKMSRDEYKQLLDDLEKFPCSAVTKNTLMTSISGLAPELSMREKLDRMVASGRETNGIYLVRDWAASDPVGALKWYEENLASGALFKGAGDKWGDSVQRGTLEYLIAGLGKSKPDLAIDLFRATPKENIGAHTIKWLAGSLAEGMIQSGDETHVLRFLDVHTGKDREEILAATFAKFGSAGKYDEGLAFVDANNSNPDARVDYIGYMVSWVPDPEKIPAAMDWALSVVPEGDAPAAARRLVYIAGEERGTAERAVMKWLDAQPEGPVRDQGYAGVVDYGVGNYGHEKALDAAAKIGDASVRNASRLAIKEEWQAWVEERGWERAIKNIRDDVVERLQKL